MHSLINAEQLRILLNDTFRVMASQPWIQTAANTVSVVTIPRGKMEALYRLEHNEWVFVPVVRTQKKGAKVIEHGFEIHREATGWNVITAALEIDGSTSAKVRPEAARNLAVQQELEKLRLRVKEQKPVAAEPIQAEPVQAEPKVLA